MRPAIPTKIIIQTLIKSGWRQFYLDSQFNILSPTNDLAEFFREQAERLAQRPFLNLFASESQSSIKAALLQLATTETENASIIANLQLDDGHIPVEIMLLPPIQDANISGFIRTLPKAKTGLTSAQPTVDFVQLSHEISTASNLETLLNYIVDTLSQNEKYVYTAIFLVDNSETLLNLGALSTHIGQDTSLGEVRLPIDDQSLIGKSARTAAAFIRDDTTPNNIVDYWGINPQSELTIPLITSKQVLGILHIQHPQANTFSASDLHFLQPITYQLAIAVENIHLFEERDRRMAELATFNQIGMIIAEHRDLKTIFLTTVRRIKSLFQVEGVSLLLLEDNNRLRFVASAGAGEDELKAFTLQPGQGIAWAAIEARKTIQVDNVKNDPRHFSGIDSALEFSTHSLLAVPIQTSDRIVGVLEVMNPIDKEPFSRDDEVTLEFIVSSVAIAIENARLFNQIQRQVDRITGLLEASRALSTLNLYDILDKIVKQAGDLLEAEHTVVYLADYEAQQIRATAAYSIGDMKTVPTPPFAFHEGTVGWVLEHKQSLRINEVQSDQRFIQMSPESRLIVNLVAVPLLVRDRTIGALEATNKIKNKDFIPDDESLLSAFASQAAIAIYNARLYQETQKQVRALTTLTEASDAITKARTLDQLLTIVLDLMLLIIGSDSGNIALVDRESQTLRIEVAQGMPPESVELFNKLHISQNIGTFGEAQRRREMIEVEDSQTNPYVFHSDEMDWLMPPHFINIPLFSGDDFIGVITLHALPSEDARALLRAVADMAAVAIDKARLFKETGQRLAEVSTLYTLAEQMTKVMDLDRITELSVIILKHAVDCSGCCLFLKDKQGHHEAFILKASDGWPHTSDLHPEVAYIAKLAEQLTTKPYPTYISDVTNPQLADIPVFAGPATATATGMHSVMIVPLVAKDDVLGAFAVSDYRIDAFGDAEGRLLTIAAAQISTAIENFDLYDHLEKRAIELEVALKEVAEANRLKSEFVQNVSHELRTPLTFILSYIELMREGSLGEIPELARDKLEIVAQKTQTITRLVEDVISLQKMEAGHLQLELTSPYELITRARHGAVANAAQYGIEITAYSTPNLPKIHIDIDRISQVFDNLVANAIKFSPSGSKVHITAEQDGDMIKFSVRDYGIGIPEHKLDKIFDRFYQVDGSTTRRYSGAGLGLAIIKQIIEVHKGRITVESIINEGTTFTFWLPIHTP